MSACQGSRVVELPARLYQAGLQRSWSVASASPSASAAPLCNVHGSLALGASVASLFDKCLLSCIRLCAWRRSCASFTALGTTARFLFASGRLHNLSVKRTHNGGARLLASAKSQAPSCAAYLGRYASGR